MRSPTSRGFSCFNGVQTCISLLTSATVATVTCESGTSAHFSHLTVPFAVELTDSASIISTFSVWAPMVQLKYQSSDLPPSSITPSPTTTSGSTGDSIATTSSSNNNAALITDAPVQDSLPVGSRVGIGVGVAAGVIILAIIGFCAVRVWRRRRLVAPVTYQEAEQPREQPPPFAYQDVKQSAPVGPVELGGTDHITPITHYEMPADAKVHELY